MFEYDKNKIYYLLFIFFVFILLVNISCTKNKIKDIKNKYIFKAPITTEKMPDNLKWVTNDSDLVFASPDAKKGGIIYTYMTSFPNTFRLVGPDNNNSFATYLNDNELALIGLHPNTENFIPILATHWAFGDDGKTVYFKLNKKARWSDGVKVTAHDYAYTLKFMRSKEIVDPYYNEAYSKEKFGDVLVFDDYTIAVRLPEPKADLLIHANMSPTPSHFYGELDDNFIQDYNWKIVPNTGPYIITKFKKGENVIFERKKDWWAKDLKYFKNRFNVDKVVFNVIKEISVMWEYFKKEKIDVFPMFHPDYWYNKSDIKLFKNGYINKIWFYNETRQSPLGFYLNDDKEIFKDQNVRYAFAHAMNIQKVIETILRNEYFRLEHAYIGYGKYSNNTIRARRFDLDKVDYYMKESGWKRDNNGIWEKNGRKYSVTLTYSGDLQTPRFVLLKEEAKKAGIDLKLEMLDGSADYKKVMEKKHDVVYWAWTTKFRPDYYQLYHSKFAHKTQTNNITNTDNKELDKLIEIYRKSVKETERIELSHKIQQILYEIGDFVPTFMIPYVRQGYWGWWRLPEIPGTKSSESLFDPFDSTTGGLFWYDENKYKEIHDAMKKGKPLEPVQIIDNTYKMEILK